jgi:hypothetical protein
MNGDGANQAASWFHGLPGGAELPTHWFRQDEVRDYVRD